MKHLLLILAGSVTVSRAYAQSTAGITGKPDTSYSVRSAYEGIKKTHPDSKPVTLKNSPSVKVKKDIVYHTLTNRKLRLDVFYPIEKKTTGPQIAILLIHGGGWRSGNKTIHHPMAERLAELGYVCFTPEYRLSTEALFPAAVYDIKAAISWVRKNAAEYNIDPNRIVAAGHSAGGHLAAFMGATNRDSKYEPGQVIGASSEVNAVIDMDGILAFIHPESGEGDDSKKISAATNWLGYSKEANPEIWKEASPLYQAHYSPPFLFINSSVARMHAGRNDYIKMLNEWHIPAEVRTFENAPHAFPLFDTWFEPTIQVIDIFLKNRFIGHPRPHVIIVSQKGDGDFKTIAEAFKSIPSNDLRNEYHVFVKNGVYKEKLHLDSTKLHVRMFGDDKFETIITWDDHTGKVAPSGDTINTRTSWTFKITCPDFKVQDITFRNDAGFSAGQAVAVESDGIKSSFYDCRFIGNQDVLFTNNDKSYQYYYNCYIEGTTDFIFGSSTAWFEKCHIHSKKNSHITAASTPQENEFGYIFNDCILTGDTSLHNVSLGRPWRPFANVIYKNCYVGPHIKAEGWSNWNNTDNYKKTRYAEYKNFGPSSDPLKRVNWSKQLTDEEAGKINVRYVLKWYPG